MQSKNRTIANFYHCSIVKWVKNLSGKSENITPKSVILFSDLAIIAPLSRSAHRLLERSALRWTCKWDKNVGERARSRFYMRHILEKKAGCKQSMPLPSDQFLMDSCGDKEMRF